MGVTKNTIKMAASSLSLIVCCCLMLAVEGRDMSEVFKGLKTCPDCIAAGYGWCSIRRMCGGFANRECGEGERFIRDPALDGPGNGADTPPEKSDCVTLTDANFDKFITSSSKPALVEFYAPWCGHCKSLKPAYEKVCTDFKDEDVTIAMLDATEHKEAAEKFEVTGFPTIKWFGKDKSNPKDYESGRDEKAFVEWINKEAGTDAAVGGGLSKNAGKVKALDDVAAEFMGADAELQAELLAQAEKIVEGLKEKKAKLGQVYITTMKRVIERGTGYPKKESDRLKKVIKGGQLSKEKKTEFQKKVNILSSFKDLDGVPSETVSISASGAASSGSKLSRADLYKMSYEDLVKKVLELQG